MLNKTRSERLSRPLFREAIIRSVLFGIAGGAAVSFALSTLFWFIESSGVLVSVIAFLITGAAVGIAAYFLWCKPTVKKNAKRLDRYGLEERCITMLELEGDDSFIATLQRNDAIRSLEQLDEKRIKMSVGGRLILLAAVLGCLFAGMTAVEALSEAELMPDGKELYYSVFPPPPEAVFKVTYEAGKGGSISGEAEQDIVIGGSASEVVAVPDKGYIFIGWSDGGGLPSRKDENIRASVTYVAKFVYNSDLGEYGKNDSDKPDDVPGAGQNTGSKPGNSSGTGGKYIETNQVIDGKTYYRDFYDVYYEEAMKLLASGEELPPEYKEFIELYYGIIE